MIPDAVLAAALGGLIGSLPISWVIARLVGGVDLRTAGSGSAGATNVLRTVGPASAAVALALDVAKGAAAVIVARASTGGDAWSAGAAALCAVAGHAWSPWLGFRGGRGVAPAAGALGVLAPWALAGAVGVFAVALAVGRWVSLASLSAAGAFPLVAVLRDEPRSTILTGAMVAVVIGWRHRANLQRLRHGREPRLGRWGASR